MFVRTVLYICIAIHQHVCLCIIIIHSCERARARIRVCVIKEAVVVILVIALGLLVEKARICSKSAIKKKSKLYRTLYEKSRTLKYGESVSVSDGVQRQNSERIHFTYS